MKKLQIFMLLSTALLFACQKPASYSSFDEYPVYEGDDLELTFTPEKSKFRVWAPTASEVKLLLYNDGYEGSAYEMHDMKRSEKGTWTLTVKENLEGKFYTFQAKVGEEWLEETPGMWVKATGVNGKRAAIIDFAKTNPEGWENDVRPPLKNFTDIVIYEVHMRDFSVAPNSGMKNKGKFLAFTEHGTKNTAGESTGIDHLVDLGITHVHLLPSYDYASIDETKLNENKYNWGYDPQNYNVPEGGYSTNPYDPATRVREFKQMVQSLHKSGIRVIMDVVYNHTFVGGESHLNQLVPDYFYRFRQDSTWSNASGCGNETASERAMMRKFIIESVVYWATEYKVDGFRFDLMGIHDIETMNAIRAALDKVDPTIYVYGEGWTADSSPLPEEKRAVKKNAKLLNNIGVFSDDLRDALKGSWMNKEIPGFASGVDSLEESVKFGITAAAFHPQVDYTKPIYSKEPYTNNPTQIINYVSCHDDMCLVDKLNLSKPAGTTPEELVRFNKLAQSVVFTSMGVPFMYAGEEVYRNKKGVNNTYQSPDSINQIDWDNKTTYRHVYDYYKGLIALRKAHPAFRIPTQEMMEKHLKFNDLKTPNVVAFTLGEHANGDEWKNILVIHNGNRKAVQVEIPTDKWTIVAHDAVINLNGIKAHDGGLLQLAPSSTTVLYTK
ncbi:MAG: type I pullulanase [Paludibacter sp.]|nr:type I pullulanase [Paludibacter sp.]